MKELSHEIKQKEENNKASENILEKSISEIPSLSYDGIPI
jgi:hypothetical protein